MYTANEEVDEWPSDVAEISILHRTHTSPPHRTLWCKLQTQWFFLLLAGKELFLSIETVCLTNAWFLDMTFTWRWATAVDKQTDQDHVLCLRLCGHPSVSAASPQPLTTEGQCSVLALSSLSHSLAFQTISMPRTPWPVPQARPSSAHQPTSLTLTLMASPNLVGLERRLGSPTWFHRQSSHHSNSISILLEALAEDLGGVLTPLLLWYPICHCPKHLLASKYALNQTLSQYLRYTAFPISLSGKASVF